MPTDPPDQNATTRGLARFAAKARSAAQALKDEYESGRRGEDTPAAPIWPTPGEQLAAATRLLQSVGRSRSPEPGGEPPAAVADDAPADDDAAAAVRGAMRGVDWARVRAATADRSGEAARAARSLAEQVDWARVQPAARQVSGGLIAAIASGQLRLGGPLGSLVAKAIVDQAGLGRRVGDELAAETDAGSTAMLSDLATLADREDFIDTTARDA